MNETPRIVTLLPSATEIVCALGFEDQLVGRSHECDFPRSVVRVPALTEPKFNPEGTSAEIDQRVKKIVGDALSVYRVDAAKLRELRPDVIVTQSQCEVCAVSERDVEAAVAEWLGARPKIVSLAPYGLDDIFTDMQRVADALDAHARGTELVERLRARLDNNCGQGARRVGAAERRDDRVDRSADGGGKLDADAGRDGGRRKSLRQSGRAFAVDEIRRAGRKRSRCDPDFAVRLQHGSRVAGPARADESCGVERD